MDRIVVKKYKEDDIAVSQSDSEKCIYKVISGSFALYINYKTENEYLVGIVSAPNFFGEMTILTDQSSDYTAVAVGDASLLCIPKSSFDSYIEANPQNAVLLIKTMAKKIAMLNMNMDMLTKELSELCTAGKVDNDTVRSLAERYSHYTQKILPMFLETK